MTHSPTQNTSYKSLYILSALSLALYVFYYLFWPTFNLYALFNPTSIKMTILVFTLPVLLISLIPSYVIMRRLNVRRASLYVNTWIFIIAYIPVSFISVIVLFMLDV